MLTEATGLQYCCPNPLNRGCFKNQSEGNKIQIRCPIECFLSIHIQPKYARYSKPQELQ